MGKTVRVYPSPDLPPGEYLPGIGADGAELPEDEAKDLMDRGLAVKTGGWTYADPFKGELTTEPPAPVTEV